MVAWNIQNSRIDTAAERCDKAPQHEGQNMAERFERHKQPWTSDEIQKLHLLAKKGMALKAIAKALTRSEESVKDRAKTDGLTISKLR
jgi:DNA-binding NarL/FixJ family response regulator